MFKRSIRFSFVGSDYKRKRGWDTVQSDTFTWAIYMSKNMIY